jgi:hypothetical protein
MIMGSIEEEFRGRNANGPASNILLLRPADAVALVRRCRERGVAVLGVDAFHLTATTTQPDMGESIDLSQSVGRGDTKCSWDQAEEFLARRITSGLYFEVVINET